MSLLDIIKDVEMFKHFTENEKQFFADLEHSFLGFNDGDTIIKQGDNNISLYLLLKGSVNITKSGNSLPLATLSPGAIFGEMSFLSKKPRYSNVVADGSVTVIKMDSEFFREVKPEVKDKIKDYLIEVLINRLDAMNEALDKISRFAQCRRLG